MKLFKVTAKIEKDSFTAKEVYIACDSHSEAEKIFISQYPNKQIRYIAEKDEDLLIRGIQ